MNIGPHTFEEFKQRATEFHGYAAPGLLLGGYMVAAAQQQLPPNTLFEAVVETKKCLPDAVQLLTLCSAGNNWMKVINLGKYAVSLFDKFTGQGFRIHLDVQKMAAYPEIASWFLKKKSKQEQDTDQLLLEIKTAGSSICSIAPIQIHSYFLGHNHMGQIGVCSQCGEAYPSNDGFLCRGCQGEAPYIMSKTHTSTPIVTENHNIHLVSAEEAVGKKLLHDMTQIIPGEYKGAAYSAGQIVSIGDVCRLQQMGRFTVAVETEENSSLVHENTGAEQFATRMSGNNVEFSLPPREGKINLRAQVDGLLCVDVKRLEAFNMVPDVMCASRQDAMEIKAGSEFAGTRVIPLFIHPDTYAQALHLLDRPLFSIAPLRTAKVGILVTGTEVFKGIIQDKFIPLISAKVAAYGCTVVHATIAPDDKTYLRDSIASMHDAGVDLLITTGGLSVDPDDVTRAALIEAGLTDILYGTPVLPGTMTLTGRITTKISTPTPTELGNACIIRQPQAGEMQVLGVPACALYFKTTLFDILLPRLLAGRVITRYELARMGEGGFCTTCKVCTWPKCFFVK